MLSVTSACTHLQTSSGASADMSSSERIDEADRLYSRGHYSEAHEAYLDITRDYPSFSYAWFKLGNTSIKTGHADLSVACYERAISLDGNDQRYWYNLSLAHLQLAKQRAQAALQRNPQADNSQLIQLIAQIDAAGQL
ncbi:tetratricopeptide repeat protein [Allohahella sp. A8]|uniref:tetratricopeptide repeat protein n=1 Tax=Allohahella sp. A8 TaxID=3141461 RepID=UPI003A802B30